MQQIQPHSYIGTAIETIADFQLVNELLTRFPRYKIPEHLRDKAVGCISKALESPDIELQLTAVRMLSHLEKQNIDIVKLCLPKKLEKIEPRKLSDKDLKDYVEGILLSTNKKELPCV